MKTKIAVGTKVTLLSGVNNPRMVEYTVTKVGSKLVTLESPTVLFPQRVCRELVALAISKNS